MQIPAIKELLQALKNGTKDDLALITQYLEHKECRMELLVRAAFREGCLVAVIHILKQKSVKEYLRQISAGDRLISILQTAIDCGRHRQICELYSAVPELPSCLLFNANIKKILDPKPQFMWHRQLAKGLNRRLPSEAIDIIFNFLFSKKALVSQKKITEISATHSVSNAKRSMFTTV